MPKSVYKDNFPDMAKGVRQAIEDRYIEEKTMRGEAGGGRGFKNPMTVPEINTRKQYQAEREVTLMLCACHLMNGNNFECCRRFA